MLEASVRVLRAGGGAGAGPRFDDDPVFWGLRDTFAGGALGGGGGGALLFFSFSSACTFSFALRCSMYSLMKSAFSSIWSSVIPISSSSFSNGCHEGSLVSMAELRVLLTLDWLVVVGEVTLGGMMDCGCCVGVECLCPNMPPKRPWLLCPFVGAPPPLPIAAPNGLFFVFLWAFFSRSSIFFLKVFASFSSAKERPARQSSSSKVWKKTRSWLYVNVSYISWSQMTPRLVGYFISASLPHGNMYTRTEISTSLIQKVLPTRSLARTAAPCNPV